MSISPYEIFLKVAELGNITRAAEAMNYTQSGISRVITSLEEEMGFALFIRGQKGVQLTRNGQAVLEPIRSFVSQRNKLEQAIAGVRDEVRGTIRLGAYTSISAAWTPHMIRAFQQLYPKVSFELIHGINTTLTDALLQGSIDCALMAVPHPAEGLTFRPLFEDAMVVALPHGHPLSNRESLTLQDIASEDFILPMKGADRDVSRILSEIGRPYRVNYVLDDDIPVMAMVANGFGIGVIPSLLLRTCAFRVVTRPLNPTQSRVLGVATLPVESISTATRAFADYICSGELDLTAL